MIVWKEPSIGVLLVLRPLLSLRRGRVCRGRTSAVFRHLRRVVSLDFSVPPLGPATVVMAAAAFHSSFVVPWLRLIDAVLVSAPRRVRDKRRWPATVASRPRMLWHRQLACGVGVVGIAALAVPAVALAHANLIRVAPANGAVVKEAPRTVRLVFDDVVRAEKGMRAVGDSGGSVLGTPPYVVRGREVVIPLRRGLPKGDYTVLWRVLSDDGHVVAGVTTFAIGAGQARPHPALAAPGERSTLQIFARWLFFSGVLLAGGLALFRLAMPGEAAPPLWVLFAAFAFAVIGGSVLVERTSLSTRFGLAVAVGVGIAAVGAVAVVVVRYVRRGSAGVWLWGLLLIPVPSAAGHALDRGRSRLEFAADVLHVGASSIWVGGLVAIVLAGRRRELREPLMRRFSAVALASVAVLGATGVTRAFGEMTALGQVWGTSYGRLLVLKTGLFAALIAIGWLNRYRVLPSLTRAQRTLRRNLGAEILLFVGLIGVVAILTQSRPGRDRVVLAAPAAGVVGAASPSRPPPEAVVLAQAGHSLELAGVAANAVSIGNRAVMWETVVGDQGGTMAVVERDLRARRTRTFARDAAPQYGLAATADWIVYAIATSPPRLVALRRRNGRRSVLADSLAAPFAWRGNRVAWAEQAAGRQRVIVYDLSHRSEWVVADLPSCVHGLCYRIDAVTLARRGVVFDRGAIGAQPSFVMRRAFSAPHLEMTRISHDPQPDLIPSSAGAAYYTLAGGWYHWDFGEKQPRRIQVTGPSSLSLVRYEDRRWLLLDHRACADTLIESLPSGRMVTVVSPAHLRRVVDAGSGVCLRFAGVMGARDHRVTTWLVVPRGSHSADATGVIAFGR